MQRGNIGRHRANLPWAGKSPPDFMCDVRSDSTFPAATEDEEFGHIPDERIAGGSWRSLDENESGQFAVHFYQERMAVRVGPVKWKRRVGESAIVADLEVEEFAEIVDVEFEQVGQDGGLLGSGGDQFQRSHGLS